LAVERIARARRRITAIAEANGLKPLPSATNFVAIDCGHDGPFAKAVLEALLERDVFARKPIAPGLDRCIRVSCGLDVELDVFAEVLPLALVAAQKSK
jgi:histidinol-phosphate aminotransferase